MVRSSTNNRQQPESLTSILAWLAVEMTTDAAPDLAAFQRYCAALAETPLDPPRYHRILDLFYDRAHNFSEALRPRLSEAGLPLGRELRTIATALIAIHGQVASGYERVLRDAGGRLAHNKWRNPAIVAARALRSLSGQLETSYLMATAAPPDLWRRAHSLARSAREYYEPEVTVVPGVSLDAEKVYKAMLALAATQPEGFSPTEVALAYDYLAQFATAVEIVNQPPAHDIGGWYWVDMTSDSGPIPQSRRDPPPEGDILYCGFQRVARLAGEQIAALKAGVPAGNLRLPERAASYAGRCALKRMQAHWIEPPQRKLPRRHHNYRAQIRIGLTALWHMLESDDTLTSEWMVLNESATGFAVMHVAGDIDGLAPGCAVGLRADAHQPWNICVVRWIKNDHPEHVALGLEMLSPSARSVRLIFRNGDQGQLPTLGLLLPPVPALREHAALLTPIGSCGAKRFFIVSGEATTQVTQGRLLSLDLQTASLELFQFEPDPYPI